MGIRDRPDRVLGYAVHTSAFAPTNAIAFGDYSYYNIGDRGSRSFAELRELFAGNGMVGYVAKGRVGGKLILPEAVKILKLREETASSKAWSQRWWPRIAFWRLIPAVPFTVPRAISKSGWNKRRIKRAFSKTDGERAFFCRKR